MTSEHQDADLRTLADDAQLRALTAKAALEQLTSLVFSGELDISKDAGADLYATTMEGITGHLDAIADALGTITHAIPAKEPKEPEQPKDGGRRPLPFDLDMLDRARESEHELRLLSDYACALANSGVGTEAERGINDAVALMTERAADVLGKLTDVASEANARQRQ